MSIKVKVNVHFNKHVGSHTNAYGVEVSNGEGTRDANKEGYYLEGVAPGQHVVGRQFVGDYPSHEQQAQFRNQCESGTAAYEILS